MPVKPGRLPGVQKTQDRADTGAEPGDARLLKRTISMDFYTFFRFCTVAILATAFTACDPCDNHVLQEEPDPSGKLKVVVFQRECGVLGGMSTQVSILPVSTTQLLAGGNVFGADTNEGQAPAMPSGGPAIAVKWINEQELQIAYDTRVRVFQSEKTLGPVTITYNAQTETEARSLPEPSPSPSK